MPGDARILIAQAKAQVAARQYAEAIKMCRRILLSNPEYDDVRILLGLSLLALRRYDEVRAEMIVVSRRQPNRGIVHRLIGEAYAKEGHRARAIESLELALSLEPYDQRLRGAIDRLKQDKNEDPLDRWFDPEEMATVQSQAIDVDAITQRGRTDFSDSVEETTHVEKASMRYDLPPEPTRNVDPAELIEDDGDLLEDEPTQTRESRTSLPPYAAPRRDTQRPTVADDVEVRVAPSMDASRRSDEDIEFVEPAKDWKRKTADKLKRLVTSIRLGDLQSVKKWRTGGRRRSSRNVFVAWGWVFSIPLLVGAVTFFLVRGYFESQLDAKIHRAVEATTEDGLRSSLDEALDQLSRRAKDNPQRLALWARMLATLAYDHGDVSAGSKAESLLQRLTEKRYTPDAWLAVAYLKMLNGDIEGAQAVLQGRSAEGETGSELAHLQAQIFLALGNDRQALAFARRAVELWPTSVRHVALLTLLTAQAGDASAALTTLDAFPEGSKLPAIRITRARVLQESGRDPIRAVSEAQVILGQLSGAATAKEKAWACLIIARQAVASHDMALALREAQKAGQVRGIESESFHLALAEIFFQVGATAEAEKQLLLNPKVSADSNRRALISAEVRLALGKPDEAEAGLLKAEPGPKADLLRGQIAELRGRSDKAREFYEKALMHPRETVMARIKLAHLSLSEGDYVKAKEHIDAAQTQAPSDPRIVPVAVKRLLELGEIAQAEALISEAMTLDPSASGLLSTRAAIHLKKGEVSQAYQLLRQAIDRYPGDPTIETQLGQAARAMGRASEAKAAFNRALRMSPNLPQAFEGLAGLAMDEGRLEEAKVALEKAESSQKASAESAYLRAQYYVLAGMGEAAIERVRSLAELHKTADLWTFLAALQVQAERDGSAAESLSKAAAIDRANPTASLCRATIEINKGRLSSAARMLSDAEKSAAARGMLRPQFKARTAVLKGRLKFELGEFKTAVALAGQALEQDPHSGEAHLLIATVRMETGGDPVPELRLATQGLYTPPEAWSQLALRLPVNRETCQIAEHYSQSAPSGYDASKIRTLLTQCTNVH